MAHQIEDTVKIARVFATHGTWEDGGGRTHAANSAGMTLCGTRLRRYVEADPVDVSDPQTLPLYVDCRRCGSIIQKQLREAHGFSQ